MSRSWRDGSAGIELEFWFATSEGPLRAIIHGERSVFFLAGEDALQHQSVLAVQRGTSCKPLALRDFSMAPVTGIYSESYRQARQLADGLRKRGAEPLEADINPADRYLMERFIAGGARLHGPATDCGDYSQMVNPTLRPAAFVPALKVVSFDIETAMAGLQLYSIAIHATGHDGEHRRVFMVGADAS
ncbi:MAG TPA: DNA polymerase II, partial [Kineobactrum sp.]